MYCSNIDNLKVGYIHQYTLQKDILMYSTTLTLNTLNPHMEMTLLEKWNVGRIISRQEKKEESFSV